MVLVVGEEENAGACIDLQGERNSFEFIFRTANHVHTEDKIAVIVIVVPCTAMRVRLIDVMPTVSKGAANAEACADKPVKAVLSSAFIHEIRIEGEDRRYMIVAIIPKEAIAEIQLEGEIVGREGFEADRIHKADRCADGIVIRSGILTSLTESGRTNQNHE